MLILFVEPQHWNFIFNWFWLLHPDDDWRCLVGHYTWDHIMFILFFASSIYAFRISQLIIDYEEDGCWVGGSKTRFNDWACHPCLCWSKKVVFLYFATNSVSQSYLILAMSPGSCQICYILVWLLILINIHCIIIQAGPDDNIKEVALKILQNGVATVPIIHSPSEDGSCPQLLHLASLSGVLKCEKSTHKFVYMYIENGFCYPMLERRGGG